MLRFDTERKFAAVVFTALMQYVPDARWDLSECLQEHRDVFLQKRPVYCAEAQRVPWPVAVVTPWPFPWP